MTDEIFNLMNCFPNSFINDNGEVILSVKGNVYFDAKTCETKEDIAKKLFYWVSRPIGKGIFYEGDKARTRQTLLNRLNRYLETNFSFEDMALIYQKLGNGVNPSLTDEFINSGFDMEVLKGVENEY